MNQLCCDDTGTILSIEYELTMEDLIALNYYHIRNSPIARHRHLIVAGVLVVFALTSVILPSVTGGRSIEWTFGDIISSLLPLVIIGAFLYGILSPTALRWQSTRVVKKTYSKSQNRGLIGRHKVVLTPENLVYESDIAETKTDWATVTKMESTASHLFIFTSKASALAVPCRAFSDESEYSKFYEATRRYYESSRA